MANYPGSQNDRQQRIAQASQAYDQVHGTPLPLVGKDALLAGDQFTELPVARYYGTSADQQHRVARSSQAYDQVHGTPLPLIGKDAVAPGQSTLDTRRPVALLTPPFRLALFEIGQNAIIPEKTGEFPTGQATFAVPRPEGRRPAIDLLTIIDPSEVWLFGTDAMPTGAQSVALPPRAVSRAVDYSWSATLIPALIGQDALPVGAQSTALPVTRVPRAVDLLTAADSSEFWIFGTDALPSGSQSTALPVVRIPRSIDLLTFTDPSQTWLYGTDALPTGDQFTERSPRAALRANDYSWDQTLIPTLVGQDAMLAGQQWTALPPIGPVRARDYSFVPPANLPVLTTVVQPIPDGEQLTDSLPPRAVPRAREYSWDQTLIPTLVGQDALTTGSQFTALVPAPAALRARDYSLSESFPLSLIGQDALPVGEQSTALAPIAALRARDYTFAPAINLCCLTTVVQQIPDGQQHTELPLPPRPARAQDYTWTRAVQSQLRDSMAVGSQSFDLPTHAPARASQLTDPGQNFTLIAGSLIPEGQQSVTLPPRAALRARDYSITGLLPRTLLGQDSLFGAPGEAQALDWPNPNRGPLRIAAALEPGTNLTLDLAQVIESQPPGAQSTDNLPPRAAARSRDYTWLQPTQRQLIGQDAMATGDQFTDLPTKAGARTFALYDPGANFTLALAASVYPVGQQSLDLPAKAASRAKEYGQASSGTRYIGKDTIYSASGEAPAYDYPNPRGPKRLQDYTWLQSFALYVFEQLPTGHSTHGTEGPPRGPLRARDYTHLDLTKQHLIGQDALFGAAGEVLTYDWQLPTPPAPRLRDYTHFDRFSLPQLAAAANAGRHTLSDRALYTHTLSDRALYEHTLSDSAGIA